MVISGDPERGRGDVRSSRLNILEWFSKPIDFARLTRTLMAAMRQAPRATAHPSRRRRSRYPHQVAGTEPDGRGDIGGLRRERAAILAGNPVDLVVLDIGLGENSGLDLLPDLRDRTGNTIPVILFSTQPPTSR